MPLYSSLSEDIDTSEAPVPNRIKEILRYRKIAKLYPSSYSTLAVESNVSRNTVIYQVGRFQE